MNDRIRYEGRLFSHPGWSVRGVDKILTRELRLQSIRESRTVGDCVNQAISAWLWSRKEKIGKGEEMEDRTLVSDLELESADNQDEEDAELFQLQQYEARTEAERRQDAQVSRAAADYLRGGN